jgi:protein-ribulosamine 3-kinase
MTVPPPVLDAVEATLEDRSGRPMRVKGTSPLAGGCINPSARLETEDGTHHFLKWNPAAAATMFAAEADGLRALDKPGSLKIPEVLGCGGSGNSQDPGWLLLEFIPKGRAGPDYGGRLGEGLATLHASAAGPGGANPEADQNSDHPTFGWHRANFIGSLPQENDLRTEWGVFWRDMRLEPQIRMARELGYFHGGRGQPLDTLMDRMEEILPDNAEQEPNLLHGDLWSGNFYPGPSGEPVLIDPAVYQGAGEVDLAMMELFGSFPRGFVEGYTKGRGLDPEYDSFRRDLYQLYYLLVHVNLFGGGYESGSLAAAERVLRNV